MGKIVGSPRIIVLNTKQQLIKVIAPFDWLLCIASAQTEACGQALSTTPIGSTGGLDIKLGKYADPMLL